MPALTGLSLLTLVPSLFQLRAAARQRRMAEELEKSKFIPGALREKLKRQKREFEISSMPGLEHIKQKDRDAAAAANEAARRAGGGSSATILEKVQERNAIDKAKNLSYSLQLKNYREKKGQELGQTEGQIANQQARNEQEYQAAKAALLGAAQQNTFSAVTRGANAIGQTGAFGLAKKGPWGLGTGATEAAANAGATGGSVAQGEGTGYTGAGYSPGTGLHTPGFTPPPPPGLIANQTFDYRNGVPRGFTPPIVPGQLPGSPGWKPVQDFNNPLWRLDPYGSTFHMN